MRQMGCNLLTFNLYEGALLGQTSRMDITGRKIQLQTTTLCKNPPEPTWLCLIRLMSLSRQALSLNSSEDLLTTCYLPVAWGCTRGKPLR